MSHSVSNRYGIGMLATFISYGVLVGGYSATAAETGELMPLFGILLYVIGGLMGVIFAIFEWLDVRHLRKNGIEFGKWRYPFYIVTTVLPIVAVLYWYERGKLV